MIHALLIDDERLALVQLEKMLKEIPDIGRIEAYTDPVKAIKESSIFKPDVIFLDIAMPEVNGMQVAERIQEVCPDSDIVFVTAYDQFAIEAFELNALDYVLKPIQRSRLSKTIERLKERLALTKSNKPSSHKQMIRCFQSLRVETFSIENGLVAFHPLPPLKWRTTKAQELFSYLLHHRGSFVSKDSLIHELWPEQDFKKASTYLYTTVYQVRQCIKQAGLNVTLNNVSGSEGYSLDLQEVVIDVDELEKNIRQPGPITMNNYKEHQLTADLFTGDYFGAQDYAWAEGERQRLRTIWLHHVIQLATFYLDHNMLSEATTEFERLIKYNPYFEEAHWGLMKVYARMGDRKAVDEQYANIHDLLVQDLSIEVPESIQVWYEDWKLQKS